MRPSTSKYIRLVLIAGLVAALDQASKWLVLASVRPYEAIPVIPGFFNLVLVHNPGGAFGFLAGQSAGWRALFFLFFSALAVCLIFYLYIKTPPSDKWLLTGFSLIIGGAVGNLIDRIRLGEVVDFLDLYIGEWHWPAFNVADSAISIGMGIFGIYLLLRKSPV